MGQAPIAHRRGCPATPHGMAASLCHLIEICHPGAELAALQTEAERIRSLSDALAKDQTASQVSCELGEPAAVTAGVAGGGAGDSGGGNELRLQGVEYSRGNARVKIGDVAIGTGQVVAVTGANGSGKSSLFALLQGCSREVLAASCSSPPPSLAPPLLLLPAAALPPPSSPPPPQVVCRAPVVAACCSCTLAGRL